MRRYEPSGWPAVLEDPSCGRPAGHNSRSPMSLSRAAAAGRARDAARRLVLVPAAVARPAIGREIRRARAWTGMSQQALADAVGVSQATVSAWERDQGQPAPAVLLRIAAATGWPAGRLIAPSPSPSLRPGESPDDRQNTRNEQAA